MGKQQNTTGLAKKKFIASLRDEPVYIGEFSSRNDRSRLFVLLRKKNLIEAVDEETRARYMKLLLDGYCSMSLSGYSLDTIRDAIKRNEEVEVYVPTIHIQYLSKHGMSHIDTDMIIFRLRRRLTGRNYWCALRYDPNRFGGEWY